MYKMILIFFTFLIFNFSPTIVYAQRSVGKVEKGSIKVNKNILDIPIEQWIDKKFLFPENPKSLQEFGYHLSLKKKYSICVPNPEFENDITCNLKYNRFVGLSIKVIGFEKVYSDEIKVVFLEERSGLKIYGTPYQECITDIVFLNDMENAKKKWIGKTIYSKRRSVRTYDEKLDKYGELKVKIGEPLKVTDIWWGFSSCWPKYGEKDGPLWVIVESIKGEKGFIPTAFSWTNIYKDRWTQGRPWDNDFFEFNPKQKYRWSNEIWELINNRKVRVGMNKDQVKLSWGNPDEINKDIYESRILEQWIYESQYLYFENDKLTAIQSR